MRIRLILLPLVTCLFAACNSELNINPDMVMSARQQEYVDSWAVSSAMDSNVDRAVIVEHTVYPYHFEGQTAELTEIGKHNVEILADYYKGHPGPIVVVRANVSDELYQQRTDAVRTLLQKGGADVTKVALSDGKPGGDGISSQEIRDGYEAEKMSGPQSQNSASTPTGGGNSGSGSSMGGNSAYGDSK